MGVRARLVLLLAIAGCGAAPPRSPARPAIASVTDLLPSDLDVVVRLDVRRLRAEPAFDGAERKLAEAAGSSMLRRILPALEGARAVWIGGRIMPDGFHGDGVVAIEANSSGGNVDSTLADPSLRRLGGAPEHVQLFERSTDARDEAALEVWLDDGGILLATPAEVDAVLRIVRAGADASRLEPPLRGLASFAGRSRRSTREAGIVRAITNGLASYTGSIDGGDAVHLETDLVYESPGDAARAAASLRSLVARLAVDRGPLRSLADSMNLAENAQVVRVRASVPFAVLAYLH
jgi:hypothetical protein